MLCNTLTEQECIDRNLFGDKAKRLDCLDEIKPGDFGFPLHRVSKGSVQQRVGDIARNRNPHHLGPDGSNIRRGWYLGCTTFRDALLV